MQDKTGMVFKYFFCLFFFLRKFANSSSCLFRYKNYFSGRNDLKMPKWRITEQFDDFRLICIFGGNIFKRP